MTNYISSSELQNIDIKNLPKTLDSIDIEYKNIKFHIYGILHGITGGTNQIYKSAVNKTIEESKGLKLSEKSMKKMYKGIDEELEDWVQMSFHDVFWLTLQLVGNPFNWWKLNKTIIKELITKEDRFGQNGVNKIEDIGGSMAFHMIEPNERRKLVGFPSPKEYLIQNLLRKQSGTNFYAPHFADKDWSWLSVIEPFANIPCRSIHMIETAVQIANEKNIKEVSLFIGEIHNTDIQWYINRNEPVIEEVASIFPPSKYSIKEWLERKISSVISNTEKYSKKNKFHYYVKKMEYFLGAACGALVPIAIMAFVILILSVIIK